MIERFVLLMVVGMAACTGSTGPSEAGRVEPGTPAPEFRLEDLTGATHALSDHRGKTVVLEWFNPSCPYVVDSHSEGGALAGVAQKAMNDNIVWLAINSGAPGKEGHELADNVKAVDDWKLTHPVLRDVDGRVGKAYGATTTPHMFIVDPEGLLQYQGAIDNQPMRQKAGDRMPYLERAMADIAGKTQVRTPRTRPWGCSVKY